MKPHEDIQSTIDTALAQAKVTAEHLKTDLVVILSYEPNILALTGSVVKIIDIVFLSELQALEAAGIPGFEVLGYARWNRYPEPSRN